MPHIPPVAMVIISIVVLIFLTVALWWRFLEAPARQDSGGYQPRHTGQLPAVSVAETLTAAAERIADDEWAGYLHRVNALTDTAVASEWERSVDRWTAEQDAWLRSMAAGPDAVRAWLAAGSLRHAWWAGR